MARHGPGLSCPWRISIILDGADAGQHVFALACLPDVLWTQFYYLLFVIYFYYYF
jgi:hypothetical protein